MQLLSTLLFRELVTFLMEKEKKVLRRIVSQSLLPLFFHCHDKNPRVAWVRTRGLLESPCEGARLPPALASRRLQPPPGLGTGTQVLCPGRWCHFSSSAALQASRETLLSVAKFLKSSDLENLVKNKKLWMFGEWLVRMAWKPKLQPGEAP